MLVMVADPSLYDEMGAFARVCELLEWKNMRARRAATDRALGRTPLPPIVRLKTSSARKERGGMKKVLVQPECISECSRKHGKKRDGSGIGRDWALGASSQNSYPERPTFTKGFQS
jgi:hypothetical protein